MARPRKEEKESYWQRMKQHVWLACVAERGTNVNILTRRVPHILASPGLPPDDSAHIRIIFTTKPGCCQLELCETAKPMRQEGQADESPANSRRCARRFLCLYFFSLFGEVWLKTE